MLGLIVLMVIATYLIISALVVWLSVRWAKKRGRRGWLWGSFAAFVMYNLVFWAWVPSMILQDYYCKTEGGSWVYKTPEKWKSENISDVEDIYPQPALSSSGESSKNYTWHLNKRIDWINKQVDLWPMIRRYEKSLVDINTNEVLAKEIYFQCGSCGGGTDIRNLVTPQRCECSDEKKINKSDFVSIKNEYENILGER